MTLSIQPVANDVLASDPNEGRTPATSSRRKLLTRIAQASVGLFGLQALAPLGALRHAEAPQFADTVYADIPIRLSKVVDLRAKIGGYGLAVRDQQNRGTCSAFASTFLLEYLASRDHGLVGLDLSEEYLNAVMNMANNTDDDGGKFSSIAAGYQEYGIVDEVWFRYKPNAFDPTYKPLPDVLSMGKTLSLYSPQFVHPNNGAFGITNSDIKQVQSWLDKDTPVAAGMRIFSPKLDPTNDVMTVTWGGVTMWDDIVNPSSFAGHSMALVGYVADSEAPSGGYFVFRNSGGLNWGSSGYGYLSFKYALKHIADLVVYTEKIAAPVSFPAPVATSILAPVIPDPE